MIVIMLFCLSDKNIKLETILIAEQIETLFFTLYQDNYAAEK
jgi:hypothetical protein